MYYYSTLDQSISPSATHPVSNLLHVIVRIASAIYSWARDIFYPRFRCSLLQLSSPSPPTCFFFSFLFFLFSFSSLSLLAVRSPPCRQNNRSPSLQPPTSSWQSPLSPLRLGHKHVNKVASVRCWPYRNPQSDLIQIGKWSGSHDWMQMKLFHFATRKRAEFTSVRMFSPSILIVCKAELRFFFLLLGSAAEFYIPKNGSLQK